MNRRICVLACSSLLTAAATAHPPDAQGHHDDTHHIDAAHIRPWTNTRTGETVQGAFLSARSADGVTKISIERANGDVVVFDLSDLAEADRAEAQRRIDQVKAINNQLAAQAADPQPADHGDKSPAQAAIFNAFSPFVRTRWDDRWLYVESDGLPHLPGAKPGSYAFSHPLMVGITAWQQQVPLPQRYNGSNAWQIPLHPVFADQPVSAKQQLFRGAIALAANGVPIFNPIKNDGKTDTFLAGELDEFGGHCGRADDYHYHIAPTHLQKFVGKAAPLAYALDGFPIYGLFDPDAKPKTEKSCPLGGREKLDDLNGHFGAPAPANTNAGEKGLYHYHASTAYPYLNGGMRGVVTVREDQIDPQPRANPVRDWLQPLRGAKIVRFKPSAGDANPSWSLEYAINGQPGFVNYRIEGDPASGDAAYIFEFIGTDGTKRTATYSAQPDRRGGKRPNDAPKPLAPPPPAEDPAPNQGAFALRSDDVANGRLSIDCTCDGKSRAPVLKWNDPPAVTKAFAIVMHHVPPDGGAHVYLNISNIPPDIRELRPDQAGGTWGPNTVNRRNEYAPPCSQGPGDKTYTATIYALSAPVHADHPLSRDELLAAIKDSTLATASLEMKYARPDNPGRGNQKPGGRPRADREEPPGDRQGLRARMTAFKTDVPEHDLDVVLVRPTDRSITVSIRTAAPAQAKVEYWPLAGGSKRQSPSVPVVPGSCANIDLSGLTPGAEYHYRVGLAKGDQPPAWQEARRFRTRPAPGTPFTFVIQADSHLDQNVEPAVYQRTLANMLASQPDLFIDLGDTFMTDQRGRDFKTALPQYDAQRFYLGQLAASAPLFMVLGNHDGEKGSSGKNAEDIGPWSFAQRTSRFPPPPIDGRNFTGATTMTNGVGSNYYAFEWGDAQFIILDPFWATTDRVRGGGRGNEQASPLHLIDSSWEMTLGKPQYDWLTRTLQSSKAHYRFVFIHHLVGGLGGPESRGGAESSPYFEWGGKNADGSPGFAEHRPGWELPIHGLLVKHKVSAVFYGHDHLYVQSERDGLIYQCVPQPGNPQGNTRSAESYGYTSGSLFASPGHLRVTVEPAQAKVEFIRTKLDQDARRGRAEPAEPNGAVVRAYEIQPVQTAK